MKRKTLAIIAGGLGALSLLAVAEQERRSRKAEREQSELIRLIRQELAQEGAIAVLYVKAYDQDNPGLTGGVVMEDGRVFGFAYVDGKLTYEEEEA